MGVFSPTRLGNSPVYFFRRKVISCGDESVFGELIIEKTFF